MTIDFDRNFVLAEEQSSSDVSKDDLTPNIPNFAPYLIIGGGTTAMSAFKSIRAHDPTAKVRFYSLFGLSNVFRLGFGDQWREIHALHASSPFQRYLVHR